MLGLNIRMFHEGEEKKYVIVIGYRRARGVVHVAHKVTIRNEYILVVQAEPKLPFGKSWRRCAKNNIIIFLWRQGGKNWPIIV
jgi:hypothetical protein